MEESERDRILTDIKSDSAVTREKVEQLVDDVDEIKQHNKQDRKRITNVEQRTRRNSRALGGIVSSVGAILLVTYQHIIELI